MKLCVTGSLGLVGLSVVRFFISKGYEVYGIDNDMRKIFFGDEGSTENRLNLVSGLKGYTHFNFDIRDIKSLEELFQKEKFDLIVHTASQPSHDKAKDIPIIDFEVNALGTLNMLECTRKFCPEANFIFTSTNKVYGDNPNKIDLVEGEKRYDFKDKSFMGFDENVSVDNCLHSLFGVSKLAADAYVQEYGKNFGMKTAVFRLGCITGAMHTSVKLHGFLSYLVKSLTTEGKYGIIGYKGKQVRDQIHADDLTKAIYEVVLNPVYGEVFNMGGGKENSASVLELIDIIEKKLGKKFDISYADTARTGDHICYITDYSKFKNKYKNWKIKRNVDSIVDELLKSNGYE